VRGLESEEGPRLGWPVVVRSSSGRRGGKLGLPLGVCVVTRVNAERLARCSASVISAPPNFAVGDLDTEPDPLGDPSITASPRTTIDSSTPEPPPAATVMLVPSSTVMLLPSSCVIGWS
jgi:hypothetical protein